MQPALRLFPRAFWLVSPARAQVYGACARLGHRRGVSPASARRQPGISAASARRQVFARCSPGVRVARGCALMKSRERMEPGDVVLGRFEVERFAGSGGMGDLYVARDRVTRALVALKKLHPQSYARPEERARFLREVKILSELHGPQVVRYVGHGETKGGEIVLAMEWLEGENLAARLARGRPGIAETQRPPRQRPRGRARPPPP